MRSLGREEWQTPGIKFSGRQENGMFAIALICNRSNESRILRGGRGEIGGAPTKLNDEGRKTNVSTLRTGELPSLNDEGVWLVQ